MRVLIFGEYSGRTREAFRRLGHDAWSCDLLPSEDSSPFHLQCDGFTIVDRGWDLMIAHPDCTYLTIAAEWCYSDNPGRRMKPGTLIGAARRTAREEAIRFVERLMALPIPMKCIENPIGVLSSRIRKPDQIIHPYQFGDDASKKTCLWLEGLPPLTHTLYVEPRWVLQPNGKLLPRWSNQTDSGQDRHTPSDDRWMERSRTYQGWSDAMAMQWGGVKMNGRWYHNWTEVIADFDAELELAEEL